MSERLRQARRNLGNFCTHRVYSSMAVEKSSFWNAMFAIVKSITALDASVRIFCSIAAASAILSAWMSFRTSSMPLRSVSSSLGSMSVSAA